MPPFVWIALAVFVVGVVAGGVWLTVNAIRAWRRGRPVIRQLSVAAGELGWGAYVLEAKIVALEPRVADLQQSTASLAAAVRRTRLLVSVVSEAKLTFDLARIVFRLR